MPPTDRSNEVASAISSNLSTYTLWEKIQYVGVALTTAFMVLIPDMIWEKVYGRKKYNVGRLVTVVKDQIYQQAYGSLTGGSNGATNATIFVSKQKDALLIHTAPEMTPQFMQDLASFKMPVKYILIANEVHETHASACKAAYPQAKVLCPKASIQEVEKCGFQVDGSFEDHMEVLENEFGFRKTFRADDNSNMTADRSFVLELYGDGVPKGKQCLFVAQCGFANFEHFYLPAAIAGFQGLFGTRGRFMRMFYWSFATPQGRKQCNSYWKHMVNSVDHIYVAIFQHGHAIVGDDTKEKLLKFYTYP